MKMMEFLAILYTNKSSNTSSTKCRTKGIVYSIKSFGLKNYDKGLAMILNKSISLSVIIKVFFSMS